VIELEGLHARSSGTAKRPASRVENVTITWEKGVLAVLGAPADGTTALLEVLAGVLPIRGGRVSIGGASPRDARAQVAYVPLEPVLPDPLRVDEVCELATQLHGEPAMAPAARLATLGIESLGARRVRSLSRGEVRAVSLALALTSRAKVVLIDEPLAGLEPSAAAHAVRALRERAAKGACAVVTTATVRDATSLADQLGMLTQGVFTHLPPALAHVGPSGARLRVVVTASSATEVAPFVAALAAEAAIATVETAAFAATRVLHAAVAIVVSGTDLLLVARAVSTAAARTGAKVEAIESAVSPLDAIRARIAAPRPGTLLSRPPPAMPPPASVPPPSAEPSSSVSQPVSQPPREGGAGTP
jgi:ABC-type multidrug transport system ATPase subunit